MVCRFNSNAAGTLWPPQFCSVLFVSSEVLHFNYCKFCTAWKTKNKKQTHVLVVLFHERYLLLPCVFEKDVKESTEFIHLCLLCNGMKRVQSNLYEENKAELSFGLQASASLSNMSFISGASKGKKKSSLGVFIVCFFCALSKQS